MSKVVGTSLQNSEEMNSNIKTLVNTVQTRSKELEGVRAGDPSLAGELDEALELIHQGRGRPLFYKYVGSGAGYGPYVELIDGSVKIDLINGIGINVLGHSHPSLMEASVKGALADVIMQGNLQPNSEYTEMLTRLKDIAAKGTRLKHSWLTTCGSMANENALKMCRQKNSPAKKVIAFKHAFAGRTQMMAEITDNANYRVGLPRYNEIIHVDFYDAINPEASTKKTLEQINKAIEENKNEIACLIFEPVQGEGGFNVAPKEFFETIFKPVKEAGIAVWADEVQTFGRTGEFFACQKIGIGELIDVMTIAKGLQGAATLYTDEYNPKPGLVAGTFAGATASLSAGNAVLKELSTGGYMGSGGRIENIQNMFRKKLSALSEGSCKGLIQDMSGMGLMFAFTPLDGSKEKVMGLLKTLFKNGIVAFSCGHGPFKVRFLIPAIITESQIDEAMGVLEKSLLELK
ncbi:MAG: aminotransferase class III-fold pyridoxal phosphate-dependent enzyme [Bdellovibrionales bacterium]